jgi:hypothetical protein
MHNHEEGADSFQFCMHCGLHTAMKTDVLKGADLADEREFFCAGDEECINDASRPFTAREKQRMKAFDKSLRK